MLGCNTAPKEATSVTVCGCNVKVEASCSQSANPMGSTATPLAHAIVVSPAVSPTRSSQ